MNFTTWMENNLLAWDQAVNCLFKGEVGETISERSYTARRDKRAWGCWLCTLMEWFVPNHCEIAYGNAIIRANQIARDAGYDFLAARTELEALRTENEKALLELDEGILTLGDNEWIPH